MFESNLFNIFKRRKKFINKRSCKIKKKLKTEILKKLISENYKNNCSLLKIKTEYEKRDPSFTASLMTYRRILKEDLNCQWLRVSKRHFHTNENNNLIQRTIFLANMAILLDQNKRIIFTDESTFNNRRLTKKTWVMKGDESNFLDYGRLKSWNLIMSITDDNTVYYEIVENTLDSKGFIEYFKSLVSEVLIKSRTDSSYNLNNVYFYLDNCPIHKSKESIDYFKKENLQVIFGVPYNSKFNPIELTFGNIKRKFYNYFFPGR